MMTKYIVQGTKEMKDGQLHEIREESPSLVKAEWIRASYVEHGYQTNVVEVAD
jgi:hypothetical protein